MDFLETYGFELENSASCVHSSEDENKNNDKWKKKNKKFNPYDLSEFINKPTVTVTTNTPKGKTANMSKPSLITDVRKVSNVEDVTEENIFDMDAEQLNNIMFGASKPETKVETKPEKKVDPPTTEENAEENAEEDEEENAEEDEEENAEEEKETPVTPPPETPVTPPPETPVTPPPETPVSTTNTRKPPTRREIVEMLQEFCFVMGSFKLGARILRDDNDNPIGIKKEPKGLPINWREPKTAKVDLSNSGFYVLTGTISNCIVIDIDDPENEIAKRIMAYGDEQCDLIVKTNKGYHYYFAYDPTFPTPLHADKLGFPCDLLTTGSMVYAPPTAYRNPLTGGMVHYQIKRIPKERKGRILAPMSEELRSCILHNMKIVAKGKSNTSIPHSEKAAKVTKVTNDMAEMGIEDGEIIAVGEIGTDKNTPTEYEIRTVLMNVEPTRWDTYENRQKLGYYLKHTYDNSDLMHEVLSKNYGKYAKNEAELFYRRLKLDTKREKVATLNSFWDWIHLDNRAIHHRLIYDVGTSKNPLLPQDNDPYSKFQIHTLIELVDDINKSKRGGILRHEFNFSRPVQYFNIHHVYLTTHSELYRIAKGDDQIHIKNIKNYLAGIKINIINEEKEDKEGEDTPKKGRGRVSKRIKAEPFLTLWMSCKFSNTADNFIFEPNTKKFEEKYKKYIDRPYNQFNGFPYDYIMDKSIPTNDFVYNPDDISPVLKHIENLTGGGEPTEYFLNWVARCLQKPYDKARVAIIIYSHAEGVGKNLLLSIIQKLFGRYFMKVSAAGEFSAQFNIDWTGKLIALTDELSIDTRQHIDRINDAITRDEMVAEVKCGARYHDIPDYMNFIFTMNIANSFRIRNSDRRYMIYNAEGSLLDEDSVQKLTEFKDDEKKLKSLYYYFITRDITNFKSRNIITTEIKLDMMLNDLPPYISMIYNDPINFAGSTYSISDLNKMGDEYALAKHLPRGWTGKRVQLDLVKFIGKYEGKAAKKKNPPVYRTKADSHVIYKFRKIAAPTLEVCARNDKNDKKMKKAYTKAVRDYEDEIREMIKGALSKNAVGIKSV